MRELILPRSPGEEVRKVGADLGRPGSGGGDPRRYLPTTRIVNEPGTAAPGVARPPPGGGGPAGPRSMLIVRMWFVLLSNVIVRAPFIVFRFCSTSKLVGLFSLTMVSVPLPCVLNASMVDGLNAAPSEPPASGSFARIFPSVALRITIVGAGGCAGGLPELAHAAKRTWFLSSSARPWHPPTSPNG